jgi:hypothetical protein
MSFEGSDMVLIGIFEWIYGRLEDRFGRAVAWIGTFLLSVGSLAAIAVAAWYFLWR